MSPPLNQRAFKCPFCGLRLVADDEKRLFTHEVPQCKGFAEVCEYFGLKPVKVAPAAYAVDDQGNAHRLHAEGPLVRTPGGKA